ncbi:adenylyl-sulfate kinase [Arenibacter sp. F26102]|uniref:adenylyl-sulfate kinase n=1 Tax=Arenibacter sp. F26102 TaxID=2926416 RepID=UPI001FF5E7E0|nr:adenylyl-sulfate kinase [Arenibacter sp. F26102]MCK0147140.1 adenylyl-sulfate kinase [Arenibacter sp. F26102]
MDENLNDSDNSIIKEDCSTDNMQSTLLILLTGLSGAGKSTIAVNLKHFLLNKNIKAYTLDGDHVRNGINKDLGFSPEDRSESNRRVGEISKLFIDEGIVVIASIIAPYKKDREVIKHIVAPNNYVEVFVNTSLETCEKRDDKGLYKKARAGEIENMTGISSPYEIPINSDIEINENLSVNESVELIFKVIESKFAKRSGCV